MPGVGVVLNEIKRAGRRDESNGSRHFDSAISSVRYEREPAFPRCALALHAPLEAWIRKIRVTVTHQGRRVGLRPSWRSDATARRLWYSD